MQNKRAHVCRCARTNPKRSKHSLDVKIKASKEAKRAFWRCGNVKNLFDLLTWSVHSFSRVIADRKLSNLQGERSYTRTPSSFLLHHRSPHILQRTGKKKKHTPKSPAYTFKRKKLFRNTPFHPHVLTGAHEQTANVPSKLMAAIKTQANAALGVAAAHAPSSGAPFHHRRR